MAEAPIPVAAQMVILVTVADPPWEPGDTSYAAPRIVRQIASPSSGREIAAPALLRQDEAD